MRYIVAAIAVAAWIAGAVVGWAAGRSDRDYDPGSDVPVRRYHDASRNLP